MRPSLEKINAVYFVGIGGIGMSAIARWFNANGYTVAGYDRTQTPLTQQLAQEGMQIHYQDDVAHIPSIFKKEKEKTLIVFTPAIPKNHSELCFFQENGYQILKRAQVLGQIATQMQTLAVAGTHGKTTTSSMIAHILKFSGVDSAAFLGGISTNYNSNLLINKELSRETPVVVEADEFDRSFLNLFPNLAVVTSTDADHLDIYGSKNSLVSSFTDFISQIQENGQLFISKNADTEALANIKKSVNVTSYSASEQADVYAQNIRVQDACFVFDLVKNGIGFIQDIVLPLPGFHNVENATAAICLALEVGLTAAQIKAALASYKGVKRRFEYIIRRDDLVYIDDYAHHPTEIDALLRSVRRLYPKKKITAIFQPHLYSRTRDFQTGFASSLDLADEVILLDIYPARELPISGVDSGIIFQKLKTKNKHWLKDKELLPFLEKHQTEVLLTVGAGDIDVFVPKIKKLRSVSC